MVAFKNVVEPASIALAFTVGTIINRRPRRAKATVWEDEPGTPPLRAQIPLDNQRKSRLFPDDSRFRNNIVSRFLAYFPFLIEIWYWNLTYWIYQLARAYSAHLIRGNAYVLSLARSHALSILRLEYRLRIAIEAPLQHRVLTHVPQLMPLLAKIYYSHIFIGVTFLVYAYTFFPPPTYRKIRRTMAVDNLIAFVILTAYRCMPPRLLPPEYGFIDVLHRGAESGSAWTNNRFQLTIAAMPSLHFGNAAFVGLCLWRFAPHRTVRWVAPLWPAAMLFTILATANHFVLDAVVGAVVPVLGWRLNEWVLCLRVGEEWGFWICSGGEAPGCGVRRWGRGSSGEEG